MNKMHLQQPSEFNLVQTMEPHQQQLHGRGLASADPQTRARVASAGGLKVSQDRKHMSEIGRLGGQHSHKKHLAESEA